MTAVLPQHRVAEQAAGEPLAAGAGVWSLLPAASSALGAAVSVGVCVGWALGLPELVGSASAPRAPLLTTAAGLFAVAAAVWILARRGRGGSADLVARTLGRAAATIVAALGLAGLLGLVAGPRLDLGITADRLQAPHVALWFALVGTALLWHEATTRNDAGSVGSQVPAALAGVAFIIGFLSLVGSLHGVPELYVVRGSGVLALGAAAAFLLLALSVLIAVPNGGLAMALTGDDAGGVLARRLLPAALFFPVLLSGLYSALHVPDHLQGSLERVGRTAVESGLLLALVFWTGQRLRRLDLERLGLFVAERRTRAEAEGIAQELQRRTNLLEQTTDAVFAWTLSDTDPCRIVYWNRGAEVLYGYSRGEAVGAVSHQLMKTSGPGNIQEFEQILRSQGSWAGHLSHMTKDGRWLVVESRQVLVREPDGQTLVLESNRDVTQQVRSERFSRLLANAAHAANTPGRIEAALQLTLDEVCAMLRWPVGHVHLASRERFGEFAATSIWHLDDPSRHEPFRKATEEIEFRAADGLLGRAGATTKGAWVEDVTREPGFGRGSAAREAGLVTGAAVPMLAGPEVVGILEFFTTEREPADEEVLGVLAQVGVQLGRVVERQWFQEVRQLILDRVITAQEDERRRIARELHDSIGQHLTALLLRLGSLRGVCSADPISAGRLAEMEELAHTMGTETRDLALKLRPVVLDDLGLASALSEYADRWSSQAEIPTDVQISDFGAGRLSNTAETALYRVVQEALTNVARHAEASRVSVILQTKEMGAQAIVEDNGKGFDPDQLLRIPAAGRRLGLLGMQERIALVGGTLTVESSPGCGTTVYVRVPLKAGPAGAEAAALSESQGEGR